MVVLHTVKCATCQSVLQVTDCEETPDKNTIFVRPCRQCLDDAEDIGRVSTRYDR